MTSKLVAGGTAHALIQTGYDAAGRVECVARRMNPAAFAALPASACTLGTQGSFGPDRIAKTIYDDAGQVTKVQTALGVTGVQADEMTGAYSNNGKLTTLTDAEGNKTTYVYDGHDRLSQTQYPSKTTDGQSDPGDYEGLTYEVTAGGTRTSGAVSAFRNRAGQTIGFAYDALGRMIGVDRPGSELDFAYAYDLLGRMTSASQPNQWTHFTHDALGRLTTQDDGGYGVTAFQYDAAGRRTRMSWPGFTTLYVDYDHLVTGEVTAIRENGATSGVGVLATFSYDDLGRRTSLTRGNGTATSYTYGSASRLASLSHDLAGTSYDLTLGFGYNPASQIVSNTRSNDAYSFLASNGSTSSTVNGLNQLLTHGGAGVTHDARGNMAAVGGDSFSYDSLNRMVSASPSGGNSLYYDPLGNLFARSHTGSQSTTYWLNVEGRLIGEYDPGGGVLRRYVHGSGVDEPLVWYEGSGTSNRRFLHADERGSIVAVSDNAGTVTAINRYDEYGQPQGGTLTGRFGYTGQAWLPELGLYHYKARVYHPGLGRFMQPDPIGYEAGMNLQAYVGNDPVNFVDPLGLMEQGEIVVTGSRCRGTWVNEVCADIGGGSPEIYVPAREAQLCPRSIRGRPMCDSGEFDEIVITGRRPREVAVLPNTDGTFSCRFIGGRNVWVSFQNHGPTNRADVDLLSYPAYANGEAIPQLHNLGSNPFFQQASTYILHFGSFEFDLRASASSATGLYNHLAIGRRHQRPVNELDQFLTVTIYTDGGSGSCGG